jgi:CRISPR-associated protein Csm5
VIVLNDSIEVKKYRLSAITPVYIGGASTTGYRGIALIKINDIEYLVDTGRLFKEVSNNDMDRLEDFVDSLTSEISNGRVPVLENILTDNSIELDTNISRMMQKGIVVSYDRNEFIRTGLNEPYIPGSSIKGAIRSAVLWKMLKEHSVGAESKTEFDIGKYLAEKVQQYEAEVRKSKKGKSNYYEKLKSTKGKSMTEWFLQSYKPMGRNVWPAFRDLFKAVKVSDSPPIINKTRLGEKSKGYVYAVSSKNDEGVIKDKSGKFLYFASKGLKQGNFVTYEVAEDQYGWVAKSIEKFSNHNEIMFEDYEVSLYSHESIEPIRLLDPKQYECFIGSTHITITLDKHMLKTFRGKYPIPFENIDKLIEICKEYALAQWNAEKEIYVKEFLKSNIARNRLGKIKRFYDNTGNPTLRIGWGTGMLGTTVALCMDMEQRMLLRNTFMIPRGEAIAPKSRRYTSNNGRILKPLGWVSLEEVTGE